MDGASRGANSAEGCFPRASAIFAIVSTHGASSRKEEVHRRARDTREVRELVEADALLGGEVADVRCDEFPQVGRAHPGTVLRLAPLPPDRFGHLSCRLPSNALEHFNEVRWILSQERRKVLLARTQGSFDVSFGAQRTERICERACNHAIGEAPLVDQYGSLGCRRRPDSPSCNQKPSAPAPRCGPPAAMTDPPVLAARTGTNVAVPMSREANLKASAIGDRMAPPRAASDGNDGLRVTEVEWMPAARLLRRTG